MVPEKFPNKIAKIKEEKRKKIFSESETAEIFEENLENLIVDNFREIKTQEEAINFTEDMKYNGYAYLNKKEEELRRIDQTNLSENEKKKISNQIQLFAMEQQILLKKVLELETYIQKKY